MGNAKMSIDELYKTSDLYIAAYLLSKGLALKGIDRRNSQRCDFVFIDREDRPGLVRAFTCGQAEGNLTDFLYHLKRAKRVLYSSEV